MDEMAHGEREGKKGRFVFTYVTLERLTKPLSLCVRWFLAG